MAELWRRNRPHFIIILFFALLAALLYACVLFGQGALWGFDWIPLFHPYTFSVQERWQQGHLLLWNPQMGLGYPQFAEGQSLDSYPPMWVLLKLMPSWWACSVLMVIHLGVAASGTYVFCLRRALPSSSAILAACTFAFSGFMTVHYHHPTVIAAVVWMPWLLALLDMGITTGRLVPYVLGAGLILALQLLGGHQQFTFYSLLLAVAYTLFRCQETSLRQSWRRGLNALVILSGVGIGISCFQLVATYTMVPWTLRRALPSEMFVSGFGLPVENFFFWFLPHLFGDAQNYMGRSLYGETNGYVTVLPWLLAITGFLLKPRDRDLRFWTGVVVVALLLAITDSNPVYSVLPYIPLLNAFRAPARYIILAVFGMSMLMGHGHALLLQNHDQNYETRRQQNAARGLSIVALLISISTVMANFAFCGGQHFFLALLRRQPLDAFFTPVRTLADAIFNSLAGWDSAFLLLNVLVGSALINTLLKRRLNPTIGALGLGCLLLADLFHMNLTMLQTITASYFTYQPPTVSFIKHHDEFSRIWAVQVDPAVAQQSPQLRNASTDFIEKGLLQPNFNIFANLNQVDVRPGLDLLRQFNLQKSLNLNPGDQFFSATDEASKQQLILHSLSDATRAQLLNLLNVRYIITTSEQVNPNWHLVYNESVRIYENRAVLPRAFLVGAVQEQPPNNVLNTLLDPDFQARRIALVEAHPTVDLPSQPPPDFTGSAKLTRYSDTEIRVVAQSNHPALLVIGDAFYPDWRAWVDGVETPIIAADYALRGVALPPGQHSVVCRYAPRWWGLSVLISVLTTTITLMALLGTGWRSKKRGPSMDIAREPLPETSTESKRLSAKV